MKGRQRRSHPLLSDNMQFVTCNEELYAGKHALLLLLLLSLFSFQGACPKVTRYNSHVPPSLADGEPNEVGRRRRGGATERASIRRQPDARLSEVRDDEVGVDYGEVPPVPIPNTEVKLTCADDTWLETARENRFSPTHSKRAGTFCTGSFVIIVFRNPNGNRGGRWTEVGGQ